MSNLSSEFREYEADDLEALMGEGTDPQTQTVDGFDLHAQSESTVNSLNDLRRLCHIPPEVEMVVPEPYESPESGREDTSRLPQPSGIALSQMSPNMLRYLLCTFTVAAEAGYSLGLSELLEIFQARESQTSGYYALYPIMDRNLIDGLPLKDNAWRKFWFFFRINNFSIQSSSELLRIHWSSNLGPQIRPAPSIDFLNFYKAVLERPVNWNSLTLERIHGAGFSVKMNLTHPVDPPPTEIDLSSLNARDRRKIKEANKKVKDQISLVGRNKKNATSTGDDNVYRKTLLVDDGSLEGSKSMAVTVNDALPSATAADNVVAATAEEEGLVGDSSLMKKRKAEELEPLLQGRPKNTRKGKAAPSNLSIPKSAEAHDVNPNSGIVLKEPLGSGMLPPRRPRGNTSRVRSSRAQDLLPELHPNQIKRRLGTCLGASIPALGRSFHPLSGGSLKSRRCISVIHSNLPSRLVQETAGLDTARQEEVKRLEKSGEETRKILLETEQRLETALADHDFAKSEIELLRSELNRVKTAAEELERKNESLSELKDRDVRKISHDARKEVKGAGQKFLLVVQEFITTDKAWNKLNSERDEMKSNLDLIKEIEDGTVNLAEEKETVGAELAETEAKLATAPQPYLNLQQFASEFADSPPLTEPNIGLSLDEMMLTGSPRAHFNEFGTNVDRISSGRAQGFSGQDPAISSIMGDDFGSRSKPRQDVSSLNPEVVPTTQGANVGDALVSKQVGDEGVPNFLFSMASPQGEPSNPNPPRFPSSESLFPSGDGFTPQGVAIPCFLSSMAKEEKIECHEFILEQITERYVFLCSERQRLGRKRRNVEDRIARSERKIRRLESDVHNWERRGFDSIARIPGCLREHIRKVTLQRNLSDLSKMIGDDLPGTSDIELVKAEATGEPEESRRLGWGTSIQVPNVLIERLSAQDRVKAEEFINKLITQHNKLKDEKKENRRKKMELEKRRLDIARELRRREAHPSNWIEIGLQEYGNMPDCIMSIVYLAGQGAELFRNPRPF
ncbi:hypothetical protein ISN45_Aa04g008670 [Arabidopsis thaliana x Arabidopsis arenosa]|uniref:Uncharacterized protein n=1 Tax=Arabidopsis thaliana x Arabidopsis arenosa TaxID=1240361 RepID=A0A8T2A6I2_9BRAS|nr:hypothetical protein ISN45_Aa04g008670 [Arabidopsis thaliana x Arabidopsis arenosa]